MKKVAVLRFLSLVCLCISILISCASRPVLDTTEDEQAVPQSLYVPESFDWQNVCTGVDRFDFENAALPVRWHAVRIELRTEGLELAAFPGTAWKGTKPHAIRTADFAEKYGCTVAVNTSPFTLKKEIVGIHIVQGRLYAPPVERYSALVFKADSDGGTCRASITGNQTEETVREAVYAFGGFFTILQNGQKSDFRISRHDSRSGAGISEDGRILYILVVEGEHPHKSMGLSYPQCADIFRAMGCTDAIEFDGGSSSDLCINGKSVLSYTSTTVQAASFGIRMQQ
jgi:hypothetical protein